jgi:hypothetical protein
MKKLSPVPLLGLLVLLACEAKADENLLPYVSSCLKQDYLAIEDVGSAQARVVYINSDESCSNDFDQVVTSDNGIAVHIVIQTGSGSEPGETIFLTPVDASYWSDPPVGYLLDDSTLREFIIQGGMS